MNRRGLFALAGAAFVASCTPELAAADAPIKSIGTSRSRAWYLARLHEQVLQGVDVCTRTAGPLHDAASALLKRNENTTRMTEIHGFIYWRTPRSLMERERVADLLVEAAKVDPTFMSKP